MIIHIFQQKNHAKTIIDNKTHQTHGPIRFYG